MNNEAKLTKSGRIVLLILALFFGLLSRYISLSAFTVISESFDVCILLLQVPITWLALRWGLLLLGKVSWPSAGRRCHKFIIISQFLTKLQILFLRHLWRGGGFSKSEKLKHFICNIL